MGSRFYLYVLLISLYRFIAFTWNLFSHLYKRMCPSVGRSVSPSITHELNFWKIVFLEGGVWIKEHWENMNWPLERPSMPAYHQNASVVFSDVLHSVLLFFFSGCAGRFFAYGDEPKWLWQSFKEGTRRHKESRELIRRHRHDIYQKQEALNYLKKLDDQLFKAHDEWRPYWIFLGS